MDASFHEEGWRDGEKHSPGDEESPELVPRPKVVQERHERWDDKVP